MEWSLVNGHLTISGEITHTTDTASDWPWYPQRQSIQSVSFSNAYFTSGSNAYGMFSDFRRLISFNSSGLNTSNVTNMGGMFYSCALTSLDLSNFDTSNVTDMNDMFSFCRLLTSLNLSSFDTSNVTDMSGMFSMCTALTSLNLSNFDTSKVTKMNEMFTSCSALTSLDLSHFNISNVTDMAYMFSGCSATIPVLYVHQAQCTTGGFAGNKGTIYLVRDSEVAENTAVRDFWRSVANIYNNVHFEYDDATRPTVTPEISRGKLVDNQWQADESGNTIKIKLNEQVYNNNISSVLSENKLLISYEEIQNPTGNPSEQGWYEKNNEEYIQTSDTQVVSGKTYYNKNTGVNIEIPTAVNYTVKQDLTNNLFYVTLNTDSDKQYDVNVILTDLSNISVTRSIILPGVFAMIEFKTGGHGMSIGKICEREGLEVNIPTTIGKNLLPPIDGQGKFDLTNYQLVIGKYNEQKNNPLFIIGNGTDETHRSNLMEVGTNSITIGNINNMHTVMDENGQRIYVGDGTLQIANLGYDTGRNISDVVTSTKQPYFTFGQRKNDTANTRGIYSFAEGYNIAAQGYASHAEGYNTEATGLYSHVEGCGTADKGAIGYGSHAEGYRTAASGGYSHAEGYYTIAGGNYSHAQGYYTTANGYCETTIGRYSVLSNSTAQTSYDTTNSPYILVLGNGTGTNIRSNAMTVDWSGQLTINSIRFDTVNKRPPFATFTATGSGNLSSSGGNVVCSGTVPTGYTPIAVQLIQTNHNYTALIGKFVLTSNGVDVSFGNRSGNSFSIDVTAEILCTCIQ